MPDELVCGDKPIISLRTNSATPRNEYDSSAQSSLPSVSFAIHKRLQNCSITISSSIYLINKSNDGDTNSDP